MCIKCIFLFLILFVGMEAFECHRIQAASVHFSLEPTVSDPKTPQTHWYFIFNTSPSTHISSNVHVINSGTASGTISLYAVDAMTSPTAGIAYQGRTALRRSVGAWMALSQSSLTLGPSQSRDIAFSLTVPRNASAGQHVGGIVAESVDSLNLVPSKTTIGLTVKTLYVVPIVVNVSGKSVEQLLASSVQLDSSSPFQRVLIGLSNTGNRIVRCKGSITITDSKKKVMQSINLSLEAFLPLTAIQYPINIVKKALPVGMYKARIVLTYGLHVNGKIDVTFSFQVKKVGKIFATLA